jgi:multidrug resistance protein, MATE family
VTIAGAPGRVGAGDLARTWRVTAPLLVAYLAQAAVPIVDTVILGRVSTTALAAVALAVPVYLVAVYTLNGWAAGVQIVVARRHGAGETAETARVADVGLAIALLLGLGAAALLVATGPAAVGFLTGDAALAAIATEYLTVVALALPFVAASATLQASLRGLGRTAVTMHAALLLNAVNLPVGVLLVFGLGLGASGAALATVVSSVVVVGWLAWYARRRVTSATWLSRANLAGWRPRGRRLWTVGWPEMTLAFLGLGSEVLLAAVIARLGETDLAAYRVVDGLVLPIFMALLACSTGVAVLAGHRLGARDPAGAERAHRAGLVLATGISLVGVVPVVLVPELVFGLFTPDPAVLSLAVETSLVAILWVPPMILALGLSGLLRAAGDTRTVMVAALAGNYLVLVPLAWVLSLELGVGLVGVWWAWLGYTLLRLAITLRRVRTGAWRTAEV